MALAVPGHSLEDFGYGAQIGQSGEGQAGTDEGGKGEPIRIHGQGEHDAKEDQQACTEAHLALEGPTCLGGSDDGQALLNPGGGAAFQNRHWALAGFEEGGGHASALAHLTDKEKRPADGQVFETGLDLVHGNVDGAGDVAGGEFGR
jgi:hypothetical protein